MVEAFHRHCGYGTTSWYRLSLECNVEFMLQSIWSFGLPMFCADISKSINHFLKHGHNEHITGREVVCLALDVLGRCLLHVEYNAC